MKTLNAEEAAVVENQARIISTASHMSVDSNTFVFFAAFDGTNNSEDPIVSGTKQTTSVQQLYKQVKTAELTNGNLKAAYYAGVGTPGTDAGSSAIPTDQIIKTAQVAYNQFAMLADAWLKTHENGNLETMITSFSRGGGSAAIFSQMLYEKGLVTVDGRELIPPGQKGVVSAALIIDPVLTGINGNKDFPDSVENLTVIRADDEYRSAFRAADYQDPNANILHAVGNHGDLGGFYDLGLGAKYLEAYTSFFKGTGLSIADVAANRLYQGDALSVHSESTLGPGQVVLPPWNIPEDNTSLPRQSTVVGIPVAHSNGGTYFVDYQGTIVLGGDGNNLNLTDQKVILLPGATATLTGTGIEVIVYDGATVNFISTAQVSTEAGVGIGTVSGALTSGNPSKIIAMPGAIINATGENIEIDARKAASMTLKNGAHIELYDDYYHRVGIFENTEIFQVFDDDKQVVGERFTRVNDPIYGTVSFSHNIDGVFYAEVRATPSGQAYTSSQYYYDGSSVLLVPSLGMKYVVHSDGSGVYESRNFESPPSTVTQTIDVSGIETINIKYDYAVSGPMHYSLTKDKEDAIGYYYFADGSPISHKAYYIYWYTYTDVTQVIRPDGSWTITFHYLDGPEYSVSSGEQTADSKFFGIDERYNAAYAPGTLKIYDQWFTIPAPESGTVYSPSGQILKTVVTRDGVVVTTEMFKNSGGAHVISYQTADGNHIVQTYDSPDGKYKITTTAGDGSEKTAYYSRTKELIRTDWSKPDGSHGTIVGNSNLGFTTFADGSTEYVSNDVSAESARYTAAKNSFVHPSESIAGSLSVKLDAAGAIISSSVSDTSASSSTIFNKDGSYVTTVISAGSHVAAHFNADFLKESDSWVLADGRHGSTKYSERGEVLESFTYQTDGSYEKFVSNGESDSIKTLYNHDGDIYKDYWTTQTSSGSHDYAVIHLNDGGVSIRADDNNGLIVTSLYDTTGFKVADRWSNSVENSHGSNIFRADGSRQATIVKADGELRVDEFGAGEQLLSSHWERSTGEIGNDLYSPDGSYVSKWQTKEDLKVAEYYAKNGLLLSRSVEGTAHDDVINGEGGTETLSGGMGNDNLSGHAGDDTIIGGRGDDTLDGGAGADVYVFGKGDGIDSIRTQATGAADVLRFDSSITASEIHLSRDLYSLRLSVAGAFDAVELDSWFGSDGNGDGYDRVTTIEFGDGTIWTAEQLKAWLNIPTDANDIIQGSTQDETLQGLAGDDTLIGGGGEDLFLGGTGNDLYVGGSGTNTFVFAPGLGRDSISGWNAGGQGRDRVLLGEGVTSQDLLFSVDHGDLIISFKNSNTDSLTIGGYFRDAAPVPGLIVFSDGTEWIADNIIPLLPLPDVTENADTIIVFASQEIHALGGDDSIQGIDNVVIYGDEGNDNIYLESGNNARIFGGDDRDSVYLGEASHALIGGDAEDDSLVLGHGNSNSLNGGGGNDFIRLLSGDNNVLDGGSGDDYIEAQEGQSNSLSGGDGNDRITLYGGSNNILAGGNGNDTFEGSLTNGTINGDDGNDSVELYDSVLGVVHGNVGDDVFRIYGGRDNAIFGETGSDRITADGTSNHIYGQEGEDRLYSYTTDFSLLDGGSENDQITVLSGSNDTMLGGAGDDVLSYGYGRSTVVDGGTGNDTITLSGYQANTVLGGDGADIIKVAFGSAVILGGGEDDTIRSGSANQFISGGRGNDTITSEAGNDVIAFNSGDGKDLLTVLSPGATVSLGTGISYEKISLARNGENLVLLTGSGEGLEFVDWYAGSGRQYIDKLQVILDDASGYSSTSADSLLNKKIQIFNFASVVSAFDAANASGGGTAWNMLDSLRLAQVDAFNDKALGGNIAYQYAVGGDSQLVGLTGLSELLSSSQFGADYQILL
ncbi:Ca2+-binding RTX toxin-like protein [Duganella sp. SG902]|uniref:calcium-binding protein n=1 Tax=Duganella sp. SG902 TaxID=2587016 RepID=UPI00159E57BE|nr:Ca2+-binding RTX toxin-like protein [Duganella sp. SG902]